MESAIENIRKSKKLKKDGGERGSERNVEERKG
jgi:hypothetical protein